MPRQSPSPLRRQTMKRDCDAGSTLTCDWMIFMAISTDDETGVCDADMRVQCGGYSLVRRFSGSLDSRPRF